MHDIYKDLDFHVRVRAHEKCVSGKQPLLLNCIQGSLIVIIHLLSYFSTFYFIKKTVKRRMSTVHNIG